MQIGWEKQHSGQHRLGGCAMDDSGVNARINIAPPALTLVITADVRINVLKTWFHANRSLVPHSDMVLTNVSAK